MVLAKSPLSFRFPDEFVALLRTWSFVTETDQRTLLQEAFKEYADRHPETKDKVESIMTTLE